jgi:hypothetical protein
MRDFVGSKYNRDLDIKEIAKLVRKDVNEAIKSGKLPQMKYSLRMERRGAQSLRLLVTDLDKAVLENAVTEDAKHHMNENNGSLYGFPPYRTYSEEYNNTMGLLKALLEAYNYDNSDIMTDYFDVNYYTSVDIEGDLHDKMLGRVWNNQTRRYEKI